jgi:pantothenate kinase-related protein Tda10
MEIVKNFGIQRNGDRTENASHFEAHYVRFLKIYSNNFTKKINNIL